MCLNVAVSNGLNSPCKSLLAVYLHSFDKAQSSSVRLRVCVLGMVISQPRVGKLASTRAWPQREANVLGVFVSESAGSRPQQY